MYESFYGFTIKPFLLAPNPDFFYLSPKHENALTYLEYGLMERLGFILLTGEIGTGKTTLIRYILNKVEADIETAVIYNTNVSSDQLLSMILSEFEIDPGVVGKAQTLDILYRFLIETFAKNKRALLVIDEAQNLSRDALEEVRMLSNIQSDDQMLLQIMLVGQPELKARLKGSDLAQLNQRINVTCHLSALTREETAGYIAFRLVKAGGKLEIFTPTAVDLIYKASGGIPRTINLLCDTALVYGFADELSTIDVPVIEQVIQDREGVGLVQEPSAQGILTALGTAGEADEMIVQRMKNLESSLSKLQMQMEWQVEELERRAQVFKDDLVKRFKELYTQERHRNDKLLLEYAKIKEKYAALQKEWNEKKNTYNDRNELIAKMKELIAANKKLEDEYTKLKEAYLALKRGNVREKKRQPPQEEESSLPSPQKKPFRFWFKA